MRPVPRSKRRHALGPCFVASCVLLSLIGCQDDPLFVPPSEKSTDTAGEGGEASGGQGGDGGTLPYGYGAQAAASYGAWSGVELPPVPIAGVSNNGGTAGTTGSGGSAGGPIVNKNCGDSKIDPGEECDDGNKLSGDGCSSNCIARCETCEKNVCPLYASDPETENFYRICYQMEGKAEQGPGIGVERKVLCHDLLDCVRKNQCAQETSPGVFDIKRCWCDLDWSSGGPASVDCKSPDTFVAGACARQFEEAAETSNGSELFGFLTKHTIALGAGYKLFRDCDSTICREECLAGYLPSSPIAQITADILSAADDAGESPVGLLIADAQRAATGTDFALVWTPTYFFGGNSVSFGLFFEGTPDRAADADGAVLDSELRVLYAGYNEWQDGNQNKPGSLVTMTLTGQQVYDALNATSISTSRLQASGLTYTWDSTLPSGQQVVEVRKDGAPIATSASFSVTMDNVLAKRGFLASVAGSVTVPASDPTTILKTYMSGLAQPVEPPTSGRIVKAK